MKKPSQSCFDVEVLERCKKGDERSRKLLYDTFAPKMFGVCLRYAKNYHSAQDVLQDGFVKVFKHISKFRSEGSFEGWLRRIFVNTAIEHYRRSVPMYPLLEADSSPEMVDVEHAITGLAAQDLMNMIQQLSPGYRTVFNLFAIEGYSHKEISAQLGISEGTSKSQLARARYLLQKMVLSVKENEQRKAYV